MIEDVLLKSSDRGIKKQIQGEVRQKPYRSF